MSDNADQPLRIAEPFQRVDHGNKRLDIERAEALVNEHVRQRVCIGHTRDMMIQLRPISKQIISR